MQTCQRFASAFTLQASAACMSQRVGMLPTALIFRVPDDEEARIDDAEDVPTALLRMPQVLDWDPGEFCDLQPVGSGGYGKVVKAWHRTTKQWVALKLIPLQLRASETVDDNNTRWSGLEVFQHLQKLRSSKVIRYGRRWSELSQDGLVFLKGPSTFEDLPSSWSASLMSPSSARAAALRPIADPVTPVSTMSLTSGFESSCGFEWVVNEEE
eukprot:s4824_g1.t1